MEYDCLYCATPLQQPAHGRKRKFCDTACKVAFHRRAHQPHLPTSNDACTSCGSRRGNLWGDSDLATHKQLGYLCPACWRIVHASKRNLPRLRQVIAYLERFNPPRAFSNEMKRNEFQKQQQQHDNDTATSSGIKW